MTGTKQADIAKYSATFDQQGFAVIPRVFSEKEMVGLLKCLPPASARKAGARNLLHQNEIAAVANHAQILSLARSILGNAIPFRATLFDKSSRSNWLVSWHQDRVLPMRERREVAGWGPWSVKAGVICASAPASVLANILAIRIHLDDSTLDNGPLRVLPGTHLLGIVNDDCLVSSANQDSAVGCLVSRGGVILMRPLLVHASSKARVDAPRRVLHVEYAASLSVGSDLELATV